MSDSLPDNTPPRVIIDTDIDSDCDDAGALALIHSLAQRGEATILAVVCNTPTPWGAPCIDAINTYYGRPDIPVGTLKIRERETSQSCSLYDQIAKTYFPSSKRYNQAIAQEFPNRIGHGDNALDAVELYRRVLSEQPDQSVVISAIGLLRVLNNLLLSEPDPWSPLNGFELVKKKVKLMVTVGLGGFPKGEDAFNWKMDRQAASRVLNHWPSTLVVSEWGTKIMTGARLSTETPKSNPVRRAYEIWLGGPGQNRSSWDQLATLYAVRGASDSFVETKDHQITYSLATGEHTWIPTTPEKDHRYIQPAKDHKVTIEDLMVAARGCDANRQPRN